MGGICPATARQSSYGAQVPRVCLWARGRPQGLGLAGQGGCSGPAGRAPARSEEVRSPGGRLRPEEHEEVEEARGERGGPRSVGSGPEASGWPAGGQACPSTGPPRHAGPRRTSPSASPGPACCPASRPGAGRGAHVSPAPRPRHGAARWEADIAGSDSVSPGRGRPGPGRPCGSQRPRRWAGRSPPQTRGLPLCFRFC